MRSSPDVRIVYAHLTLTSEACRGHTQEGTGKCRAPRPAHSARSLTGQHGGHEGGEHEEQHGEKEEAGVAQDLLGLVADAQVEQADEEANADV